MQISKCAHSILKDFMPIFLLLISLIINTTSLSATTYFVATIGDDTNTGTESNPWKTIGKAAEAMQAGDIVLIKGGTYKEQVVIKKSGTVGNEIIFMANPGDTVIIDGTDITLPDWETGLIAIEEVQFIRISGLEIHNAGPNQNNCGIYVDNAHNIIIEKNRTYNTVSSGIGVWNCSNIIVDANEVELACNDGEQECISIAGTTIFEIKNNHVHHGGPGTNGGEGICIKDGSFDGKVFNNLVNFFPLKPGIYIDAWDKHTYNIMIYNNIARDCGNDGITIASEQGGLLENIRVYNNIIYNNKNSGITVTPNGDVPNPLMKDIYIINNTIFNNGWDFGEVPWGGGIGVDTPDLTGLIIRNNIVSQNLNFQIAIDYYGNGFSIDHNLIDGFLGEISEEIMGADSVEGEPLFVDTSAADFHLMENSPAIDAGSDVDAPTTDFYDNERPAGAGIDIGAIEYDNPIITINGDSVVCENGISIYSTNADSSYEIRWQVVGGEITGSSTESEVYIFWELAGFGNIKIVLNNEDKGYLDSIEKEIIILELPEVVLDLEIKEVCFSDSILILSGGMPTGGVYSGAGVFDKGLFDIELAGVGEHSITYTYEDGDCSNSDIDIIEVFPLPEIPIISENNNELLSSEAEHYQWYFEYKIIEGETEQSLKPIKAGIYTVEITDENGCTIMSTTYAYNPTSIDDNRSKHESLSVIPNPFSTNATISYTLNNSTEVSIVITDIMGSETAILLNGEFMVAGKHSIEFDAGKLSAGVYYCTLRAGGYTETKKILVLK